MYKSLLLILTLLISSLVSAEDKDTVQFETTDSRQLVEMPEQARFYMRQDMLDHLRALNEIIGLLAAEDYETLAEVAEKRIGRSSMGKYRSTGMGPGRFMPLEMRNTGWSMHDAASELATHAKDKNQKGIYQSLQKLTTACVICHSSYRIR